MNYYYLTASFLTAGVILYFMERAHKAKIAEAEEQGKLMMAAARARTEAKRAEEERQIKADVEAALIEWELRNTGQVYYREDDGTILVKGPLETQRSKGNAILTDIKSEHLNDYILKSLGYEFIGEL